jgi:hypothetical protein
LVNQEKIGIIDQEILSCSPTVKEKITFGNSPGFQTHLDEFGLKFCIIGNDPENKRKESSCFPESFALLPNLTPSPTYVQSRDVLGIEDYR